MIDRNQIIRQADADEVPAATVERDYILSHVLAAIASLGGRHQRDHGSPRRPEKAKHLCARMINHSQSPCSRYFWSACS